MVSIRKSTSVEISWWGDGLKQTLVSWFDFCHKIICRVSLLDMVILGPASSTETHKSAPSKHYTEGNYNCGGDNLSKSTHADF